MSEWGPETTSIEQDKELRDLAHRVLGRNLMSADLHAAYAHAGVGRPPKLLPANLKKYQAERLEKWLKHVQGSSKKNNTDLVGMDPCIYCAFGCNLCEEVA